MIKKSVFGGAVLGMLLFAGSSFAYQVTGPVLELTDSKIVVKKGNDRWELAWDASMKLPADVKVGSKVTIQYNMIATSVDMKDGGAKKTKK